MEADFMTELQFDFQTGWKSATKGMELAMDAERVQTWRVRAEQLLNSLPAGTEVTADDLTNAIGVPDDKKNNVIGAWFNAKRNERRLAFTGKFLKSNRVSRHTGLQRVWIVNHR
jgi:hypothetical protein